MYSLKKIEGSATKVGVFLPVSPIERASEINGSRASPELFIFRNRPRDRERGGLSKNGLSAGGEWLSSFGGSLSRPPGEEVELDRGAIVKVAGAWCTRKGIKKGGKEASGSEGGGRRREEEGERVDLRWMKVIGESQLAERRSRRIARPIHTRSFRTNANTYRRIQTSRVRAHCSLVRVCMRAHTLAK